MKESIEAESTALAGQRKTTYPDEKERSDTGLEFSSEFFVVVLTCLSAVSRPVCKPAFGAHI